MTTQPPGAAAAAAPAPASPRLLIGGRNWSPADIFWGKTGPGNAGTINGYLPDFDAQGRPKQVDVKRREVDVWKVTALYALSDGVSLVYVGEGVLGDRLLKHYAVDEFSGRWDTFSWISPDVYELDGAGQGKLSPASTPVTLGLSAKQLVELFELLVIQFGLPPGNRQWPEMEKRIGWLKQRRDERLPPEDREILEALWKKYVKDGKKT